MEKHIKCEGDTCIIIYSEDDECPECRKKKRKESIPKLPKINDMLLEG
jgi:hypothetical protein